ncbi:MAG TPA: hypothetical protein VN706_11030 [Gemmatimonadaceae bacterium]|nr:hypothetical protein [Gemmatimonadaceae bacterium]
MNSLNNVNDVNNVHGTNGASRVNHGRPVGRVCAKIYSPNAAFPDERLVPIFQQWIRDGAFAGVLLDVADYTHVPDGPGVVLVGHETTFSMDRSDGRLGLVAQHRRPFARDTGDAGDGGDASGGVVATLQALFDVADELERAMVDADVRLDRTRIRVESNDRLRAPNTDAGFASFAPVIAEAARRVMGGGEVVVERVANDRRERLAVDVWVVGSANLPLDQDVGW